MANDSSIAASLTGISLPPSTANRSRIATWSQVGIPQQTWNEVRLVPSEAFVHECGRGYDSASLATLTEKYFESISEGKLQQEPLLEELIRSSMAERSVKTTTSLFEDE